MNENANLPHVLTNEFPYAIFEDGEYNGVELYHIAVFAGKDAECSYPLDVLIFTKMDDGSIESGHEQYHAIGDLKDNGRFVTQEEDAYIVKEMEKKLYQTPTTSLQIGEIDASFLKSILQTRLDVVQKEFDALQEIYSLNSRNISIPTELLNILPDKLKQLPLNEIVENVDAWQSYVQHFKMLINDIEECQQRLKTKKDIMRYQRAEHAKRQ